MEELCRIRNVTTRCCDFRSSDVPVDVLGRLFDVYICGAESNRLCYVSLLLNGNVHVVTT